MSTSTENLGLQILLKNLKNKELVTDVSNIDYRSGEQLLSSLNVPLTIITEAFCDNIVVVKICEKSHWVNEIPTSSHDYLQTEFLKLTSENFCCVTQCNEIPISLQETSSRVLGARRVVQNNGIEGKFEDPVCVFYKVHLANDDLKMLLKKMPDTLNTLEEYDFYLLEFNITQDFAGIFNKIEMKDYLKSNFNSIVFVKEEVNDDDREIQKDDESWGIDCLTWTDSNARVKIYNKFICEMTNSGVPKQIANNIVNFIDCPSERMKRIYSSELAQKHGILRLDVTINNYPIDEPVQKSDLLIDCDFLKDYIFPMAHCEIFLKKNITYLENAPIYSVSIPKMWIKLTDSLKNSCCAVTGNTLRYVYWVNSNTKHLTGIEIALPKERADRKIAIDYAISKFGFNGLPMNYFEINDDKILITKCYITFGETFFTHSNCLKSTISPDIDIVKAGLVHTKHVIAQVQRKSSIKKIVPTFNIHNLPDEIVLPMDVDELIEEFISLLSDSFHCFSSQREWKYLNENSEYILYAFAIRRGPDYLQVLGLAQEKGDDSNDVYRIQGFENEKLKNIYRRLPLKGYEVVNIDDYKIIYAENKQHIAKVYSENMDFHDGTPYVKCKIDILQ